jgi:DNA-3-methyladenine glycosylase I
MSQENTPESVAGDEPEPVRTWGGSDAMLSAYYDNEWGRPITSEAGLFERLSLEAFQSGLSWATILRKRENFRAAFAGFDPVAVAGFGDDDVDRLMQDVGIVRNLKKIESTITNAAATVALREEGGLAALIWSHRPETTPMPQRVEDVPSVSPESKELSKDLKRHGFVFVGPTTAHALMEAIGMVDTHLLSSHRRGISGLWNEDGTWAADPVFE